MKILIATDGSEFSQQAIEKACDMLAGGGNLIEIISVFEEAAYAGTEPYGVPVEYIREIERIRREQAIKFASEAEDTVRRRFPNSTVQITTKVIKGSPARAIVEEARDWGADLIVTGSHGYGFWGRSFLGSVSDKVVHQAECSVLVVRKKTEITDGANN